MLVEPFIRGLRARTFCKSLVQRRPKDMAVVKISATSHIKVEEFTIKKKKEEEKKDEGVIVGIRGVKNREGPFKGYRKEDRRSIDRYDNFRANKKMGGQGKRIGQGTWIPSKLTVSQKDIVKDVNTAKLLYFPKNNR
ncbi:hypothetical protein VNO80_01420 [Phaseolus coccineus]|uniref:Uncharacterized protein n=1 Tax=Phaseolus coccineus TaxID=3886 RepID=A0AAN9RSS5_PHACN